MKKTGMLKRTRVWNKSTKHLHDQMMFIDKQRKNKDANMISPFTWSNDVYW